RAMGASQAWWGRLDVVDWVKPALGGLVVGLGGIAIYAAFGEYHIFGTGYGTLSALLTGQKAMLGLTILFTLAIVKPLATATTIGSGGGGGVFSASLFVGAMYGAILGIVAQVLFPHAGLDPVSFALVGMG